MARLWRIADPLMPSPRIYLICRSDLGTISSAGTLQPSVCSDSWRSEIDLRKKLPWASVKYLLAVLCYTSQLTSPQLLPGLTSICRRSTFFMLLGRMYLGSFHELGQVEHGFQVGFNFCLPWVDRFTKIVDIYIHMDVSACRPQKLYHHHCLPYRPRCNLPT